MNVLGSSWSWSWSWSKRAPGRMRQVQRPLVTALMLLALTPVQAGGILDWFLTPDQQGRRLFEQGDYVAAAKRFDDPMWRASALYRAGDFEAAAASFGRVDSPEAHLNRGNALVLLGRYDDAIAAYDLALKAHPDWQPAVTNRAIAVARRAAMAPPEEDAGGTGGMQGADEIVIDEGGRAAKASGQQVTDGGSPTSEQELRALWLRRVQTEPKDFLKVRFARQLVRRGDSGEDKAP